MESKIESKEIKEIIFKIERSIKEKIFIDVEKTKIELKDLSGGNDWKSLRETICAFLNSDGGIVIGGVKEWQKKDKKGYKYTGFNRNNESKIIDLQSKFFKDDNGVLIDLSDKIYVDYEDFLDGEIVVIFIYPLSVDLKYVKYEGKYYERKLTQDKIIPQIKLKKQEEYKKELSYTRELEIIETATIKDFSLDKINKYVELRNKEIKKETFKPTLEKAKPFLNNQHFLRNGKITMLGMLVCGEEPFHFLQNRSEVMYFYDTNFEISKDKKIFRNDVISLMEDALSYVWSHINIGRIYQKGGSTMPEYPEKTIRETINNALAHRDYNIDDFVTITVEPKQYIRIKNPGTFKEKIKILHKETDIEIRRLIPGIPESKNPKLASILKVFDKIESGGRGMASLVNSALENSIDLPYYELKNETITLTIPTGRLVDDMANNWLDGYNGYLVGKLKRKLTEEDKQVLVYLYKSELLNKKRLYTILLSDSNNHFDVLDNLKESELIKEHTSSSEEAPVYVLDRVLMKTDFTKELISLVGKEYIDYGPTVKAILNTLFRYGKYNEEPLRAADITPKIYPLIYTKNIIPKTYESLGRKVRSICNKLEKKGILFRNSKKAYTINFDHIATEKQLF